MPDTGNGNANEVVHFEELELDEGGKPSKREQLIAFLGEKLKAEDMGQVRELLGLPKELSNAELLEEIRKELAKKKEEDEEKDKEKKGQKPEDEYEYPEEKTKKGAAPSYQDFMKSCMKSGKSLKDCAAEYKEKQKKEPSKEEASEVERLTATDWKEELAKKKKPEDEDEYPEPIKKKMEELENEIKGLKELRRKEGIDGKVDALVGEKHLSPRQAEGVKKLMYGLAEAEHEGILGIFRAQTLTVHEDIGQQQLGQKEGQLTPERRNELIKTHGLDRLMKERGGKLPGVE
jgi:hypothetical protein